MREEINMFRQAMRWELSLWIVANYDAVRRLVLGAQIYCPDPERSNETGFTVMCINLSAQLAPHSSANTPFRFVSVYDTSRPWMEERMAATAMELEMDPAPGAPRGVRAAEADGESVLLAHIYCDPIAFELRVPFDDLQAPNSLKETQDNEKMFKNRLDTRSASPHWNLQPQLFHMPDSFRPDNPNINLTTPGQSHLKDWVDFYIEPLRIASFKALELDVHPQHSRRFVHAVHIQQADDYRRKKSVAFLFRVTKCERVLIANIGRWAAQQARSVGATLDESQTAKLFKGAIQGLQSPGPFTLSPSSILYTPPGASSESPICFPVPASFEPTPGPRKWWLDFPDPMTCLTKYTSEGTYLDPSCRVSLENSEFNAWGFLRNSQAK